MTDRTRRTEEPRGRPRTISDYVGQFLTHENATLPRVLVRSAECDLISAAKLPHPILDIGSGDGTFAQTLFGDERVAVGIDNSRPQMLRSVTLGAYRNLVQASADRLPFRDASFSAAFSNSTLEHIPEPWTVLREVARVLRPGGMCIVTVPSEHFSRYLGGSQVLRALRLKGLAQSYENFFNRVCRHRHIEPATVWSNWIRNAGLEVDEWRYYYSRRDTVALEISHYLTAPSVVTRMALGRWVLCPRKAAFLPYRRALTPFSSPGPSDAGAFVFFRAHKP